MHDDACMHKCLIRWESDRLRKYGLLQVYVISQVVPLTIQLAIDSEVDGRASSMA